MVSPQPPTQAAGLPCIRARRIRWFRHALAARAAPLRRIVLNDYRQAMS